MTDDQYCMLLNNIQFIWGLQLSWPPPPPPPHTHTHTQKLGNQENIFKRNQTKQPWYENAEMYW